MEKLFDNKTPEQAINELENMADFIKEETYEAPLTEEELDDVKTRVTRLNINKQKLEDEKKEFMDKHNAEMKPLKADLEMMVREARSGHRQTKGKVYYIADQEAGIMKMAVEDGLIIGTRPLKAEERDTTIFHQMRSTGTDK